MLSITWDGHHLIAYTAGQDSNGFCAVRLQVQVFKDLLLLASTCRIRADQ